MEAVCTEGQIIASSAAGMPYNLMNHTLPFSVSHHMPKNRTFGTSSRYRLAHINGQPRQPFLQINTLAIPSSQPMHSKGVPQIIGPRTSTAVLLFKTNFSHEATQAIGNRLSGMRVPVAI